MQKVLEFTREQKELIWKKYVRPEGGSETDFKHFVEVCETFGLNPLLGDIVFQVKQTKKGPQATFITTRDGLLRAAMRDPHYVGAPISAVVREGDLFKIDPVNATVEHQFGAKKGKIIGAWARMEHAKYRPVVVFVDFDEYFRANAQSQRTEGEKGGSPIWDKFPSAMIQKVAEAFCIRRLFPLGGLMTAEEMGEIEKVAEKAEYIAAVSETKNEEKEETKIEIKDEAKSEATNAAKNETKNEAMKSEEETRKETKTKNEPRNETKNGAKTDTNKASKVTTSNAIEKYQEFTLVGYKEGVAGNGIPYALIRVKELQKPIYAKGDEGIAIAQKIKGQRKFKAVIHDENGFYFLKKVYEEKEGEVA